MTVRKARVMSELELFEEDQIEPTKPEEEFRIETLKCEICHEFIGKCDMSKFSVPMNGSMFISKDHFHGYPAPFYGHAHEWLELKCPICKNRPFVSPNYFTNTDNEKCGNTHECQKCGKAFPTAFGLAGHNGVAHKETN